MRSIAALRNEKITKYILKLSRFGRVGYYLPIPLNTQSDWLGANQSLWERAMFLFIDKQFPDSLFFTGNNPNNIDARWQLL